MANAEEKKAIYFILLQDKVGIVILNSIFSFNAIYNAVWSNTFDAIKGSLFKWVLTEREIQNSHQSINLASVDNSEHYLQNCNLSDLLQLSDYEYKILLAVPSSRQRYNLVMTKNRLRRACEAKLGDTVKVLNDHDCGEIVGRLMYIGPLENVSNDGVYFGVVFEKPVGNSNGCIGGQRYFDCELNHSLFIAAHNIQFLSDNPPSFLLPNVELNQTYRDCKSIEEKCLYVGKHVVYDPNNGDLPVTGIIRYLDSIDGEGFMAGVELNIKECKYPLGNYYKGQRKMFDCEYGKGILVKTDTLFDEFPRKIYQKFDDNPDVKQDTDVVDDESFIMVGKTVEISIQSKKHYGTVMWRGRVDRFPDVLFVGLELQKKLSGCSDGTLFGIKYFHSPLNKAFFVKANQCKPDSRGDSGELMDVQSTTSVSPCDVENVHVDTAEGISQDNDGFLSFSERENIHDF